MFGISTAVHTWTAEQWSQVAALAGGLYFGEQSVPQGASLPYAVLSYEPEDGERDSGVDMDFVSAALSVYSRTPDEAVQLLESWLREIEYADVYPTDGGKTVGVETLGPPTADQIERHLWVSTGTARFQTQYNRL